MNKKLKQVLAIIGLVIIAGLYLTTLILALTGNENTHGLFLASIFATIMVPLIMYILSWIFNLVKKQAAETKNGKNLIVDEKEPSEQKLPEERQK